MIKRITIFCLLLSCIHFGVSAQQLTAFSESPTEYIKELETFMTSSKQSKMKEAYEIYAEKFNGGLFTDEEKQTIINTSNEMLKLKMKASPFFLPYLNALVHIKKVPDSDKQFKNWHGVLQNMRKDIVKRKTTPYKKFLEFSSSFFEHGTFRDIKAGVNWKGVSQNYTFLYEEKKPSVRFEATNLIGFRKKDTISIANTQGSVYPLDLKWEGTGGIIDWKRFGSSIDIKCEVDSYYVDIKKSLYKVKTATLSYPAFFGDKKIKGEFEDKIVARANKKDGSYPRFSSFDKKISIKDIGEKISYTGGFRLQGLTFYGYGTKDNKAGIVIKDNNGSARFRAYSESFSIVKDEKILSEGAEVTLYSGTDSLSHPSINLKLNIPKKEMEFSRGKRGSDRNPFFASSQKMNVDVDQLIWKMQSDSLLLGSSNVSFSVASTVKFESLHYFDENDFRGIQNIATSNPLSVLRLFADQEGVRELDANEFAKKVNSRFDVNNIKSLLYDLVARGFIKYDADNNLILVQDKVYHYTDANAKKVDYDIINVESKTNKTNAILDIKTNIIDAKGIKNVEFSPVQQVALKPFNENIVFKENRNMDFDGRIFAGYSVLEGKDMHYVYDQNSIIMDSVRFFDLFIPTDKKDKNDQLIAESISSRIEHGRGVLLIDAPDNKSGTEEIPIFPSYNTKGASYVFYDYKETLGGVYKRDSFFFKLRKFNFNQLDNYTKEDISFKGEMHSADIFPVFKETILVREDDYSLGFVTNTGSGGYPAYSKKGKYRGEIDLSNKGFYGKGNIEYLGANADSEDLTFKPKQMTGTAKRFDHAENRNSEPAVPQAIGLDVSIDWKPYKDSMYVHASQESPFKLFKAGNYTLDGSLVLTPGGLKGMGKFEWEQGVMTSKLMSFGAFSAQADTANLQIKAFGDEFSFDTKNVNANLDFDTQKGKISANQEGLNTTMPYNQYQTSMGELDWDMKEQTITFYTSGQEYGDFLSINPSQDSLNFKGKSAFYDLKTNELRIGGVPKIQTCDAYVYPKNGDVEIKKNAEMTTLEDAKIVASLENEYHVINKATVNILGKRLYKAKGFYEYNIDTKEQEIYFADIIGQPVGKGRESERPTETRAEGTVKPEDNFYIVTKTKYQGTISLKANDKNLDFNGFAQLDAPLLPNKQWFSITNKADKKNLIIPFDKPKNFDGALLRTGAFISKESATIYPRIMQPTKVRADRAVIDALGVFKYDKKEDAFLFGDSLNIAKNHIRGNRLTYSVKDNSIKAQGKINLGDQLQHEKIDAAGFLDVKFPTEETDAQFKMEVMVGIFMHIPEKLLKIMEADLIGNAYNAPVIDYLVDRDFYKKTLAEFIDDDKKYKSALGKTINEGLKLPKKYNDKYSFLFSKIRMKWDQEYQSMISIDEENAFSSIMTTPINRMLTSYLEVKMPNGAASNDRIYLYIKSPSDYVYYFSFKDGILKMYSNNDAFQSTLLGLKKKHLTVKLKDGGKIELQATEEATANMFVNRIKAARRR